jgi:hypothetical protein
MGCSNTKTASPQETTQSAPEPKNLKDGKAEEKPQVDEVDVADTTTFREFTVEVQKGDETSLGVRLNFASGKHLEVTVLKDSGLLADWNAYNVDKPDVIVKAGDLITDVNGVSGNAKDMMDRLKDESITMTLKRVETAAPVVEVADEVEEDRVAAPPDDEVPPAVLASSKATPVIVNTQSKDEEEEKNEKDEKTDKKDGASGSPPVVVGAGGTDIVPFPEDLPEPPKNERGGMCYGCF